VNRNASQGGRLLIAAEGKDMAAETGVMQHDRHRHRKDHETPPA
jgi:hypothetical protein